MVSRAARLKADLATSFARIFYRNAFNLGVPAIIFPAAGEITKADDIQVNILGGVVENKISGKIYRVNPLPAHLAEVIREGGLIAHLEKRVAARKLAKQAKAEP